MLVVPSTRRSTLGDRAFPVDQCFIDLLLDWFSKCISCVRWNGILSSPFAMYAGVRQGFVNSIGWEFRSESYSGCLFWPTAVFMEQRRRTLLRACSGDLTSTRRRLRSAECWLSHAGGTVHQTFNIRWPCLPMASARAWNSLPSSVRNALPLTTFRRELKTVLFRSGLTMIRRSWLYCTVYVVCPRLLTVGDSVVFVCFSF